LAQDVQSWLSPPDPWKNQNEISEMRHAGTAAWFVNGETFSKWKWSEQGSLLWIQGKREFVAHSYASANTDVFFFLS
jgi:hypothetical protein